MSAAKRAFLLFADSPDGASTLWQHVGGRRREWAKVTFNEWLKVVWWNAVDRWR